MNYRLVSFGTTAAAALALWVVPSVGTRGQGTLGDRFAHTDSSVMSAAAEPDSATRLALARADAEVARAIAKL